MVVKNPLYKCTAQEQEQESFIITVLNEVMNNNYQPDVAVTPILLAVLNMVSFFSFKVWYFVLARA